MSITIALIGILITILILILISIVSNHINQRLNRIEHKLISIDNNIKYNQYLLNDKDIDTKDKDIKVVIYGNGRKIYEWRD